MLFSKSRRNLVDEQMDAADVDPRELAHALRFIRRINRALRYNAVVVRAVNDLVGTTLAPGAAPAPATLLDVGAGSGDLLVELAASPAGASLALVGLDRHALTVAAGAAATGGEIRFVRGDALALPVADASVDYVVSTMFLHHLPDAVAVAALAEMRRVARRGVIVADLLRSRRAYGWITLFTLLARPMVRHDARASVAHAFTLAEARRLADAAGMADATLARTFGHRFLLTWRR